MGTGESKEPGENNNIGGLPLEMYIALREALASIKTNLEWTTVQYSALRDEQEEICKSIQTLNNDLSIIKTQWSVGSSGGSEKMISAIDKRITDLYEKLHALQKAQQNTNRYIWIGVGACTGITVVLNILVLLGVRV